MHVVRPGYCDIGILGVYTNQAENNGERVHVHIEKPHMQAECVYIIIYTGIDCSFLSVQHFQLIMQTFVLARFEPSLVFVSQVAVQALVHVYITLQCSYMYLYLCIGVHVHVYSI